MANITLTRIAVNAQPGPPVIVLTRVMVSGSSTMSTITRTVRENWTVTDMTDPQRIDVGNSNVDISNRSDVVQWQLISAPSANAAAGALQWDGSTGGASHTGAAGVGYVTWGGAAAGVKP